MKIHNLICNSLWFGFKPIMNFGREESFITACVANEVAKRSDIYSKVRHKDIFNRKYDLAYCGDFVTLTNGHTVFKNPVFKSFQLRCAGYGTIPDIPLNTEGEDPVFLEVCQNAMNVNGEQTGFNKEVIQSLTNNDEYDDTTGLYSYDTTSFLIGLPTETDNTFQQGQTANTPITYEIVCEIDKDGNYYGENKSTPPLMALLQDTVISINVQPNGIPPVVEIGQYDVTSR